MPKGFSVKNNLDYSTTVQKVSATAKKRKLANKGRRAFVREVL